MDLAPTSSIGSTCSAALGRSTSHGALMRFGMELSNSMGSEGSDFGRPGHLMPSSLHMTPTTSMRTSSMRSPLNNLQTPSPGPFLNVNEPIFGRADAPMKPSLFSEPEQPPKCEILDDHSQSTTEFPDFLEDLARINLAFPENVGRLALAPFLPFEPKWSYSPPSMLLSSLQHMDQDSDHQDEELEAINVLNSVPPQLTPLPELLLNVPYYRLLLHFWIQAGADSLVPAPSHIYQDNPLKIIVPQMAMHNSGVLTTMLALSARARDSIDNAFTDGMPSSSSRSRHREVTDQLINRSCSELLSLLQNTELATSDDTLAQALMLSCYEVVASNDFEKHRTHTSGASQIINARLNGKSTHLDNLLSSSIQKAMYKRDESNVSYILMRWFTYVDVLGALSSTRDRENYLRVYRPLGPSVTISHLRWLELDSATQDPHHDIDYFMGFDARLFPHLINVALLIEQVDSQMKNGPVNTLPVELVTNALEVKENLTREFESGEEKRRAHVDRIIEKKKSNLKSTSPRGYKIISDIVNHDNILRATNRLFFDAGMLNLYRRVLLMPRESSLVQDLANLMIDVLEFGVDPGLPAEVCTIFCHFCAGCETLDTTRRELMYSRYSQLAQNGNFNASKAIVIMNRCWETGEDWITAANQLDIDLVLM